MSQALTSTQPARRTGAVIAIVALAAVLAVLFSGSLFGGKVLTQADALNRFQPWASAAGDGFVASNELLLDQATGFLPWNDFVAERLRAGELPLWCPLGYGGIPLVGTGQSAVYWPLKWLYFAFPSWHTYVWIACLALLLAGAFTFAFLRRLALAPGPAAVGALGYMLCGFLVAWLNHPHVHVALFLPALLWGVERAAAQPGRASCALFGLMVGLQWLGGHVQTSVHVALFVAAWAIARVAVPVDGRRLGGGSLLGLAGCALLGTLLAAPQLLPFAEYLLHSRALEAFDREDLVARDGARWAPLLMLAPHWFGAPHTHDYTGPLGPNLNFNELIGGWVGRVLLGLAVLQVVWLGWRRMRAPTAFFAASVAIAGLVACQVEPFHGVARSIPGLASTKLMRFLVFVAFGTCVLGAMALHTLAARTRRPALVAAVVFAAAAGELVWFARGYNPEVDPATLLPRTQVAEFLRANTGTHRVVGLDNTFLMPNANVFERIPTLSGYDSIEDLRFNELVLRMTENPPRFPFISQIGAFNRVAAFPLFCLLGVRYIATDASLPAPLRRVLDAEVDVWENPAVMPKAFLARDVQVVADPEQRLALLSGPDFDPRIAVLEAESASLARLRDDPTGLRAEWPARLGLERGGDAIDGESVTVLRYEPRTVEVEVRSARRGLLVVNDVWDAGWSAAVRARDGTRSIPLEIVRVDHALRGVFVEPGAWTITMRYDPWTTRLGLLLALLAGTALSWVAFGGVLRRRRERGRHAHSSARSPEQRA